jgi:hypothetical protein
MRLARFIQFAFACLGLLLALGCGTKPMPQVSVNGKVVGLKDAENVTVRLWPEGRSQGGSTVPAAVCRADGSFTVTCEPGTYKVTLSRPLPAGQFATPKQADAESAIPPRYQDSLNTPLQITVGENETQEKILKIDKQPR